MTSKKQNLRYYNLTAIAKPRSTKAYFEYMTKCSSAEFFYGKTKTGRSRLDYALVELRYFSMN